MGRLEPLTARALGRSPYDDVVEGEGEPDPHEPDKQYNELGRIINPQTKDIIKDVIRAHNEVMLVIGVAEPDNSGTNTAEAELARQHQEFEGDTGRTLLGVGRALNIIGIWGLHGIRQRMLIYKERASLDFFRLIHTERATHSYAQLLFAGMPSYMGIHATRWCSTYMASSRAKTLVRGVLACIRFHFQTYLAMQRLDLIPASSWVPDIRWFIPFSSSSPFSAPPVPQTLNASSAFEWVGKLAVNLAPYAAFYMFSYVSESIHRYLWRRVQKYLPSPAPSPQFTFPPFYPYTTTRRQTFPESPTLGAADREIRHAHEPEEDLRTSLALDGPSAGEAIPVGSIRRQSTFSSRGGEEYVSDDEDTDMVNPTLISFDVDTTESMEPPPGMWSAELRPSVNPDSRAQPKETPKYVVNPLTTLPAIFAADILAGGLTYVLCTPFGAFAYRAVARAFAQRRGLPYDHMFEADSFDGLSWQAVRNLLILEMAKFAVSGDIWALTSTLSQWLHVTEEEWKDIHKEEAEEAARNES